MRRASIENMELGNLLFGNSRGEFAMDRDEFQGVFLSFLNRNGFDPYGRRYRDVEARDDRFDPYDDRYEGTDCFENSEFVIRPYYWGDDQDTMGLPNFVYKPTGLEINWYKYPLRDAFCNQDIDAMDLARILIACEESMGGDASDESH